MRKEKFRIVPQIHRGKKYMNEGYFYAPYIPLMSTECPIENFLDRYQNEAAAQMAEEIDKEILEQVRNMDTTIILKKRNRKPNNRLVL